MQQSATYKKGLYTSLRIPDGHEGIFPVRILSQFMAYFTGCLQITDASPMADLVFMDIVPHHGIPSFMA